MEIYEIARIGRLFLDGDAFEHVLIDKVGPTDYDFERFNSVRATLLKIERIAPKQRVYAIMWAKYAEGGVVVIPLVAGSSLPVEGCKRQPGNPELLRAFEGEENCIRRRETGVVSHYYPVWNSNGDRVGVLEIAIGMTEPKDVSYADMFVPRREEFQGK